MPPFIKGICAVLCVALLVTASVAIASKVRSGQAGPIIAKDGQPDVKLSANNGANAPAATVEPQLPEETQNPTEEPVQPEPTQNGTQPTGGRSVRIRSIGDVIISEEMLETANQGGDTYDFSPLFSMAQGVMSDADWTIINIEATLRKGKYGYAGYPQFSTPDSILGDLKNCGVDMLTMCNNHMLDGYYDGLKMSLDYADAAGFKHVGAYRTQEEYDTPEIYDIGGIKIGMMNYTQTTNSMENYVDKEALVYGFRYMKNADYAGDIQRLKAAGAEFVICFMHWGEEYKRQPEESTRSVAKKLVAAGADLVIGGHPHVVQPAEYVTATDGQGNSRTALVLYSMGNFISNHRNARAPYTDSGIIFDFTIRESAQGGFEVADPGVIPVYVWQMGSEGSYDYRVLPTGQYLNSQPAGMSDSEFARMKQTWTEMQEIMGSVLPLRAG